MRLQITVLSTRSGSIRASPLLDALRETSEAEWYEEGLRPRTVGGCTVLVEGRRINSCLTLAVMHDGEAVTTRIQGFAKCRRRASPACRRLHPA